MVSTSLDSLFDKTRTVIDGMRSRSFRRIVNTASINGQKGQVLSFQPTTRLEPQGKNPPQRSHELDH